MSNESWIGRTLGGKYTITAELGKGGQGALYVAKQKGLDRDVAVKVIRLKWEDNDDAAARFEREARVIARLNHPNVVQIFDFDHTEEGAFYIVMELVTGESLHRILNTRNLDWNQSAEIVRQVAKGLHKVHEAGIVHRDIKPANIMLSPVDGGACAKLLDFGIALTSDPSEGSMTQTGIIVGTPGYLAPELTRTGKGDGRADLYSLGVVWFKMLTKALPVKGDTPIEVVYKTASQDIPPLATLAPQLAGHPFEPVLYRLLARDPAQRYNTANDLVAEIDAVLRGALPTAAPPSTLAPVTAAPQTPPTNRGLDTAQVAASNAQTRVADAIATGLPLPANTPVQTVVVQTKSPIGPIGVVFGVALVFALVGAAFLFGRDRTPKTDVVEHPASIVEKAPVLEARFADALQEKADALEEKVETLEKETAALAEEKEKAAKDKTTKKATATKRTVRTKSTKKATTKSAVKTEDKTPTKKKLTSADIDKAIAANFGMSTKCRNTRILQGTPGILIDHCPTYPSVANPTRRVYFEVAPSGKVLNVSFDKKVKEAIGACTLASLKGFRFPAFDGDKAVKISQSVKFKECTIIDGDCAY